MWLPQDYCQIPSCFWLLRFFRFFHKWCRIGVAWVNFLDDNDNHGVFVVVVVVYDDEFVVVIITNHDDYKVIAIEVVLITHPENVVDCCLLISIYQKGGKINSIFILYN